MNLEQAQQYDVVSDELNARHAIAYAEYTELEFHLRGSNDLLEGELSRLGDVLSHRPPLSEVLPGVWEPKRMGLVPVRRTAINLRLKPFAEDEILQPEQWGPYLADSREEPSVEAYSEGPYDQNGAGSCTTEAGCGGVKTCINFARGVGSAPEFNPWFVYQGINGGQDGGSSLEDAIAFLQTYGACPASIWPRSKGIFAKPSAEAYVVASEYQLKEITLIRNRAEFGTAIIKRWPVHFYYNSHSVLGTRLLSTTQFRFLNSWGDWGENGYGTIPFSSIGWPAYAYRYVERKENN